MGGLAGEVNIRDGVGFAPYHADMIESLKHRGPDDDGMFCDECAVLLHTRLAVIDPSGGRQPMSFATADNFYTIVYDGELYNAPELRMRLEEQGERFRTHCDTEIVLRSYICHGQSCVEAFNGIFAFAIWDEENRSLFIARDRMGVKPFFYTLRDASFIFSSELKGLLCHPSVEAVISAEGLSEVLFLGPGRTPGCGVFEDVQELRPGFCGHFTERGLRLRQYWHYEDVPHEDDLPRTITGVKELVSDAVRRQMVSDVPLGVFLSGGLDSGIIAALAGEQLALRGRRLKTFTVTYRDNDKYFTGSRFQPDSDDDHVGRMARYLNSEHTTVVLDTPQLLQALYRAVDARDLPGMADVDASLLLFCREIREQAAVILSGECADEIFGGYPWFREDALRPSVGFPWARNTAYRVGFLSRERQGRPDGFSYVSRRCREALSEASLRHDLEPREARMRQMTYINTSRFMPTLLDRTDRMGMYSGLEIRVPFCDFRIAEYLYSVPWTMKNLGGREKGLLRTAMQGTLPSEILWRKKSPYPKTHHPDYKRALERAVCDLLSDPDTPLFRLLDRGAVASLLTCERREPWYGQLMTTPQTMAYMIQLNYWLEKYRVRVR